MSNQDNIQRETLQPHHLDEARKFANGLADQLSDAGKPAER